MSTEEIYKRLKNEFQNETIKEGKSIKYYYYRYEEFTLHLSNRPFIGKTIEEKIDRFTQYMRS